VNAVMASTVLVLLGEDHAAQEAHLRIARLAGDVGVGLGQRLGGLALAQQQVHLVVVVGMRCGAPQAEQQCEGDGESGERGVLHEASEIRRSGEMRAWGTPGTLRGGSRLYLAGL
jgi:hypothetical protein